MPAVIHPYDLLLQGSRYERRFIFKPGSVYAGDH